MPPTRENNTDDVRFLEDQDMADPREYLADVPSRLISGVLGLMAFMICCVVGLMAGNPGASILLRAILAMIVCASVGRLLGIAGQLCVQEYVTSYKSQRPRPVKPPQLEQLDRERRAHDHAVRSMKKAA